jgi:hypothetical protein
MKGIILLIVVTIMFYIVLGKVVVKAEYYKQKSKTSDSLYMDQSENLLIHDLINIRQNDIIDKFQSSRNEKLQDDELSELMSKLN